MAAGRTYEAQARVVALSGVGVAPVCQYPRGELGGELEWREKPVQVFLLRRPGGDRCQRRGGAR